MPKTGSVSIRRACATLLSASLVNLSVAPSYAFDAGTSDPNLRQIDILIGAKQCMAEVGFLQASNELTQLLLVTDRGGRIPNTSSTMVAFIISRQATPQTRLITRRQRLLTDFPSTANC